MAREVAWGPLWTTLQSGTGWTYYVAIDKNKMLGYIWNEMRQNTENKTQDVSAGWCFLPCACCMSHLPPKKLPSKVLKKAATHYLVYGKLPPLKFEIWKEWSLKLLAWLKKVTYGTCKEGKVKFFRSPMSHIVRVNSKPIKRFPLYTHQ